MDFWDLDFDNDLLDDDGFVPRDLYSDDLDLDLLDLLVLDLGDLDLDLDLDCEDQRFFGLDKDVVAIGGDLDLDWSLDAE